MDNFNIPDLIKRGFVLQPDGSWARNPIKKGKSRETSTLGKMIAPAKDLVAKRHKYGAISKVVDGQKYDSQREYEFSKLLYFNEIEYKMKEVFVLQKKFRYCGEAIREIRTIPDYTIYKNDKLLAVVDCKGMVMVDFKIKMKLLKRIFWEEWMREIPIFLPSSRKEMDETIRELLKLTK